MTRSRSLDKTAPYHPNQLRMTSSPWPTLSDWVKIIALAVLAAMLLNASTTAPTIFARAKELGANTIGSIRQLAAQPSVLSPESVDSIHQQLPASNDTLSRRVVDRPKVVIYRGRYRSEFPHRFVAGAQSQRSATE